MRRWIGALVALVAWVSLLDSVALADDGYLLRCENSAQGGIYHYLFYVNEVEGYVLRNGNRNGDNGRHKEIAGKMVDVGFDIIVADENRVHAQRSNPVANEVFMFSKNMGSFVYLLARFVDFQGQTLIHEFSVRGSCSPEPLPGFAQ